MRKFNSPLPQPLPKECTKAAKIFRSFVDSRNNGLDGVIPRNILAEAKGFAIFTIFKAGFIFSARAGSGVVIAKRDDGSWSAPSAIGTGGLGVGTQAGAEVTDFLVVLNSRSAVSSFMSAGSLTFGGNMSIALGPLGRNGEASGAVNTKGKMAAMWAHHRVPLYSYSKTRGLFGGVSLEGSVIVERQDANALAYNSPVTARMLLGGMIDPPPWATPLIQALDACTRFPGSRDWIEEHNRHTDQPYVFGTNAGLTPTLSRAPSSSSSFFSKRKKAEFPPTHWIAPPEEEQSSSNSGMTDPSSARASFKQQFESDFDPFPSTSRGSRVSRPPSSTNPFASPSSSSSHIRSNSLYMPATTSNQQDSWDTQDDVFSMNRSKSFAHRPLRSKPELSRPLTPNEGVARAIALFDFDAVEAVTKMTDMVDDWYYSVILPVVMRLNQAIRWTGKLNGRQGIFPANFVELA
ncbi:SH3 domain-containing protein [Coprinopsis cinerea okayama7|uniref:SH3 domain-containing protein n=1 Tax=Coprinopsis cinerea (strain Okayama-7 / 130 / ATCC MYA-4618 / FGSC 9003) TaxID=240176 RepID=A8N2I4_COPC7|nr:SH3 domain-containing protein [Coprinopsis cinerea okayama7\|eukprot:XP_001829004.2 SH3 domain-containing protein [Coprinopsis cinerea okayama7\